MGTNICLNIEPIVKERLQHDSSGHDWRHIERVRSLTIHIAEEEGANVLTCELAALLHDLIDDKLVADEEKALEEVKRMLVQEHVPTSTIDQVIEIITTMSFKGGATKGMRTLEGKVVQDADRLDAIGAIGIARTFMYSGAKGQPMYDPDIAVRTGAMSIEEYRHGKSTAINHFYEKLLKLKDRMNTATGLKIAEERHTYMVEFVGRFKKEWSGN